MQYVSKCINLGLTGEVGEHRAGGPVSSSQWQSLLVPHLPVPQSLGLASAESAWWPGSPYLVQYCTQGEWAAAKRRTDAD